MTNTDVEIPEVFSISQRARFYKDEYGREMIEISFVGQKDTVVHYVTPEHMARYKREWDAYCDKQPLELRKGTSLTELFDEKTESKYVAANIHNLEELAALDDAQCQGVGRGTMTDRQSAQTKLIQDRYEADVARRKKIDELDVMPLSEGAPTQEIDALKETIGELQQGMKTLQEAVLMLVKAQPPQDEERPRRKRMGWPKGKKRKPKLEPPPEEPAA